jgi:Asp-tRNA(Asn)/Glu-tRNA(Gln) amidotransferase A subunit family amidase
MAADMASLELAYRVMAIPDPLDSSSSMYPAPRPSTSRQKVIGLYKNWMDRADAPVKSLCEAAIAHYVELGYEVVDIHIPLIHDGQTAHALTILSEAVNGFPDTSFLSPATRILLEVGSKATASDFLQAQRVRQLLMSHLAALFRQHPGLMILTPTTPTVGWPIKSPSDLKYGVTDGDMSIRSMEYVWLANFTGCPCLQIPVGYAKAVKGDGIVPIGMMAMGEWGSEDHLIEWGFEGEKYLNEVVEGGRPRSRAWFDVIGEAAIAKTSPVEEDNGKADAVGTNDNTGVGETNGKPVAEVVPDKGLTDITNGAAPVGESAAKPSIEAAAVSA